MPDPEVERAAEFLAAHAVLLLGLGMLVALVSLVAIVFTVRVVTRFQHSIRRSFTALGRHVQNIGVLSQFFTGTSTLIPSGYVALHMTLGLARRSHDLRHHCGASRGRWRDGGIRRRVCASATEHDDPRLGAVLLIGSNPINIGHGNTNDSLAKRDGQTVGARAEITQESRSRCQGAHW